MRIELDVQLINLGDPKKQKTLGGEMGRVVSYEGGYSAERARTVDDVYQSFLVMFFLPLSGVSRGWDGRRKRYHGERQ